MFERSLNFLLEEQIKRIDDTSHKCQKEKFKMRQIGNPARIITQINCFLKSSSDFLKPSILTTHILSPSQIMFNAIVKIDAGRFM
jgi:hypothetical protein